MDSPVQASDIQRAKIVEKIIVNQLVVDREANKVRRASRIFAPADQRREIKSILYILGDVGEIRMLVDCGDL